MAIYTYPHVNISTTANKRKTATVAESNATTLLAPFTCDRGPENELVAIDNFSDFVQTYGELDYSIADQRQILNIGNWLSNGGRVLACRLTDIGDDDVDRAAQIADNTKYYQVLGTETQTTTSELTWSSFITENRDTENIINESTWEIYKIDVKAKYSGTYYNNISIKFEPKSNSKGYYDVTISKTTNGITTDLEKYRNKTFSTFSDIEKNSAYIGAINVYKADFSHSAKKMTEILIKTSSTDTNPTKVVWDDSVYSDFKTWAVANLKPKFSGVTLYYTDADGKPDTSDTNAVKDTNGKLIYCTGATNTVGSNVAYIRESRSLQSGNNAAASIPCVIPLNKSGLISITVGGTSNSITANTMYYTESVKYQINENAVDFGSELNTVFTNDELTTKKIYKFQSAFTLKLAGGADVDFNTYIEGKEITTGNTTTWSSHLYSDLTKILAQKLTTPFDVMIDSGYKIDVKKDLEKLFAVGEADFEKRDDAFLVLNDIWVRGNGRRNNSAAALTQYSNDEMATLVQSGYENITIVTQLHKIEDIYSKESGKEVFVSTSYFVAGLYPYNDATYGPQWPSAGQTRGVIQGSLWVDYMPTNKEKQALYEAHINYVEKDSRGLYIMSQLTATGTNDDTALKFVNNERALLKMKRQLETAARKYLHEFNDSITIDNIQNVLNTTIANWIQNRTLSYASVDILNSTVDESLSPEELSIKLNVKFTGTIEVISIDITVD